MAQTALALRPDDDAGRPLCDAAPAEHAWDRFKSLMRPHLHSQISAVAEGFHDKGDATVGMLRARFKENTKQQMWDRIKAFGGDGDWATALKVLLGVEFLADSIPESAALVRSTGARSALISTSNVPRKDLDDLEADADAAVGKSCVTYMPLAQCIQAHQGGLSMIFPSDDEINAMIPKTVKMHGPAPYLRAKKVASKEASTLLNYMKRKSDEAFESRGSSVGVFRAIDEFLVGKGLETNNHLTWEFKASLLWKSVNRPESFQRERRPKMHHLFKEHGMASIVDLSEKPFAIKASDAWFSGAGAREDTKSVPAPAPTPTTSVAPPAAGKTIETLDRSANPISLNVATAPLQPTAAALPCSGAAGAREDMKSVPAPVVVAGVTTENEDPQLAAQLEAKARKTTEAAGQAQRMSHLFHMYMAMDDEEPGPEFDGMEGPPVAEPAPPPAAKVARDDRAAAAKAAAREAAQAAAAKKKAETDAAKLSERADRAAAAVVEYLIDKLEKAEKAEARKGESEARKAEAEAARKAKAEARKAESEARKAEAGAARKAGAAERKAQPKKRKAEAEATAGAKKPCAASHVTEHPSGAVALRKGPNPSSNRSGFLALSLDDGTHVVIVESREVDSIVMCDVLVKGGEHDGVRGWVKRDYVHAL
jgi:hypothetical protein